MKRLVACIPVLLALVLVQIGCAVAATPPRLEEIRFETPAPGVERVIFRLNGINIPKVFAIKGDNPRVVFDFAGTTVAPNLARTIDTGGRFIRRIRIGLHGEPDPKTRVVLDLVPGREIDFRQKFDQAHGSLVVTLFRAGAEPAAPTDKTSPSTPPAEKKPGPSAEKKAQPQQAAKKNTPPAPPRATQPQPSNRTPAPAPAAPVARSEDGRSAQPQAREKTAPAGRQPEEKETARAVPAARKTGKEQPGTGRAGTATPGATAGPVLHSIRFDKSSNRGEMVLFKLSEFHPPVVFGIEEGVPRVVCDFKGTTADAGVKNRISADGRYVRAIRVGRHHNPDKIRVVLDLAPNNNYDLQQVFFKDDNLFVIIVNTTGNTPTREEVERPLAPKPST